MSAQQPIETWDDGIDLRFYVDVLSRFKWLIAGVTAAAIAVAAFLSYVVLSPSYESSVVVALPAAGGEAGLGMTPLGYEEFAVSDAVLGAVRQNLGFDQNPGQLPGSYDVQLRQDGGLLLITASAGTAEESFQLANQWVSGFNEKVLTLLEGQLGRQQAALNQALAELLGELENAKETLATMDQETSLSLMGSRLSRMEQELVRDEGRLHELTTNLIPTDDAKVSFLQESLASQPQTLSGTLGGVTLPEEGAGAGVVSSNVTLLNPVYLQLSQDLAVTRTRLVTNQSEADNLRQRIPST